MPDGKFMPTKADQLVTRGVELHRQGDHQAARFHYQAALMLDPNNFNAVLSLAGALINAEMFEAGLLLARRAWLLSNHDYRAANNVAAALSGLRRYREAGTILENVIKAGRFDYGIWHNYGLCLRRDGKIKESLLAFRQAQKMIGNAQAVNLESDLGLTYLALGDISQGMAIYEARWALLARSKVWDLGIPQWQGENVDGLNILVHHEQGFGDTLQFIRFLPLLKKRGANITLAVSSHLRRLLEHNYGDMVDQVVDWNTELSGLEDMQYHVPMMSLLRWLRIEPDKISPEPYLKAKPARLPPNWPFNNLKVGLCWASGNHGPLLSQTRRYVPLPLLFLLAEIPGVTLVSLQKDEAREDLLRTGAETFIYDPMNLCHDFMDTAGAIAALDLVVSVDSSVAHLAGALGKPVVMLGPYMRCWRWWGESHGLPWYKNFDIVRQSRDGNWAKAAALAKELVARGVKDYGNANENR